jgi:hypothetical protein
VRRPPSQVQSLVSANRFAALNAAKVPGPTNKVVAPIERRLRETEWGVDTMASVHCTGTKTVFAHLKRCSPIRIKVANNDVVIADHVGTVTLRVRTAGGNIQTVNIKEVYYCKDFAANLLSGVNLAQTMDAELLITSNGASITTKNGSRIPLRTKNGVCTLDGDAPAIIYSATAQHTMDSVEDIVSAHQRLGHIGFDRMIHAIKLNKTRGLGELKLSSADLAKAREIVLNCAACREGRGTNTPLSGNGVLNHGTAPAEAIHFDTFHVVMADKSVQYGVAIVDPFTGLISCPRVTSKDQIPNVLIAHLNKIETITKSKVKFLYTDGGSEFINHTIKSYCTNKGITLHYPPARTPQWNGIAERTVRTIKDGARTLLRGSGLPDSFWYYAVSHFIYLSNRTQVSRFTGTTPFESCYGQEASVSSVSTFGCDVYVWLHKDVRDLGTFASRGTPGVYLGHDPAQNCPIVLCLESKKEIRTRSVDYRETQFRYSKAISSGASAVQQIIVDSEVGGNYAWVGAQEESTATFPNQIGHPIDESVDPSAIEGLEPSTLFDELKSNGEDNDPTNEWEVERISAHRLAKDSSIGGLDYSVHWVGYKRPTWEHESNLGGCQEVLNEYRKEAHLDSQSENAQVVGSRE